MLNFPFSLGETPAALQAAAMTGIAPLLLRVFGTGKLRGTCHSCATTAMLLVLQRLKFKTDNTGKWSMEIDKKSAGDSA